MRTLFIKLIILCVLSITSVSIAQEKQELTEKRTGHSKTYSNSDGSFTTEISLGYRHYKDSDGKYKEIKKDFVVSDQPGYDYQVTEGLYSA